MKTVKLLGAVALCGVVAACAGRDARPVNAVDVADKTKSCSEIQMEMKINNDKIVDLLKEESRKRGQNIAAGAVGAVLFWPALFAMDFKDAAGTDRKALQARQEVLNSHQMEQCTGDHVKPITAKNHEEWEKSQEAAAKQAENGNSDAKTKPAS